MEAMNAETKARLSTILSLVRLAYNYSYIPVIIYLGLKKGADPGMPELTPSRNAMNDWNIDSVRKQQITGATRVSTDKLMVELPIDMCYSCLDSIDSIHAVIANKTVPYIH
ncbi:unnamed protein product [Oppiella nova]|uniref:Mitochondrial import receptor subunit TOM7 homolog n=1 Tax=Oppiella nova TaxID=334625 RepID=A0A7R9QJL5_9ACAR|nr:unnamed protein product [Oppiella nova]CAG2166310.1 unnamed protein product [Oppiella nova]